MMIFPDPGCRSESQVFDAGLCRSRQGDGVALATQPGRQPENIDLLDRRRAAVNGAVCHQEIRLPVSILNDFADSFEARGHLGDAEIVEYQINL